MSDHSGAADSLSKRLKLGKHAMRSGRSADDSIDLVRSTNPVFIVIQSDFLTSASLERRSL